MSLAEVLTTFVLVSLLFGLMAGIAREVNSILRHSEGSDAGQQVVQNALARIRAESQQATALIAPSGTGVVNELTFDRIAPTTARLPQPAFPAPPSWEPQAAADTVRVRFFLNGSELHRQVVPGPANSQRVASSLSGFTARRLANGNLELVFSVLEENRVVARRAEIFRLVRTGP